MAAFVVQAHRVRVVGGVMGGEIGMGLQENLGILNIAHGGLVIVQAFEQLRRKGGQQGMDDLDHVAELLEGHPHLVNGGGVGRIDPPVTLGDRYKGIIHHLQDAPSERLGGFGQQRFAGFAHAPCHAAGFQVFHLLPGGAQQAFFALLQVFV